MTATLLFDIDGTLVRTGGAGKAAMEAGLRAAFGLTDLFDGVPYSGRTDPAISHDLLTVHGLEPTAENHALLRAAYLAALPASLRDRPGHVCPGVPELIARLETVSHVRMGLLTGNIEAGARHKLQTFGLWDRFRFGAFGDGRPVRADVARAAVAVAEALYGPVDANTLWVIGDTPDDVSAARAVGAKALAVCTGWHPRAELEATGADLVLDDLSDFARLPREWF